MSCGNNAIGSIDVLLSCAGKRGQLTGVQVHLLTHLFSCNNLPTYIL